MTAVLLVGKGSFLGRSLAAIADSRIALTALSHDAPLDRVDFRRFDAVVNMTIDGRYRSQPYEAALDRDLAVARAAAGAGTHMVMISSRKVYGLNAPFPASEDAPAAPTDRYGENKLATEAAIRALGPEFTILRLANAFGYEPGRSSFFGAALDRLKRDGRIVLDVAQSVRRDFIPVEEVARVLADVLVRRPRGLYNLGAGQATALGDIARWLIQGYGRGEVVVEAPRAYDNFLLDCSRLFGVQGIAKPHIDVEKRCHEIGRQLTGA